MTTTERSAGRGVLPWLLPAAVLSVLASIVFWEGRPGWAWCVDGDGWGECSSGRHDWFAIVEIVLLAALLAAITAVALRPVSERRTSALIGLSVALGVVIVGGLGVALEVLPVPMPDPPIPSGPSS